MYLIRELAAKYDLTRTALLHYDAIGLLSPSSRTEAGYRLYGEAEEKKLRKILLFRSMGISLEDIKQLMGSDRSKLTNALLIRLDELNREIEGLKERQAAIINLFKEVKTLEELINEEDDDFNVDILFRGIDPVSWHEQFEMISPVLHKDFIEMLDRVPEGIKQSLQKSIDSLPEKERKRLNEMLNGE